MCDTQSSEGYNSLYTFSQDRDLREKWIRAVKKRLGGHHHCCVQNTLRLTASLRKDPAIMINLEYHPKNA